MNSINQQNVQIKKNPHVECGFFGSRTNLHRDLDCKASISSIGECYGSLIMQPDGMFVQNQIHAMEGL